MIDNERVLAIILGRAGSKGLRGKNSLVLSGRPMIAHTIAHAQSASTVDRIVVSTDGRTIAEAARQCGVEVILRPAELASDTATVDAAARHAIETSGDDASIIVILYANVPIRPPTLIDRAVALLHNTAADSVQSYCATGKNHPWWMCRMGEEGRMAPFDDHRVYRRQDLPALFMPDGGIIAVRRQSLFTIDPEHPHAFLGKDRRGIETQPGEVIDIDTPLDLRVAEAILVCAVH